MAPSGAISAGAVFVPWRACVVVCSTCAGKRPGGLLPDGRTEVRDWLRRGLQDVGAARAVQVAEATCLGVCPTDGTTALIVPAHGTSRAEAWVLGASGDREGLLRTALAAAGSA